MKTKVINKITITVGIPAYNEEKNIRKVLQSILSQKSNFSVLKEIIVLNDGSTDNTVQEAIRIKDKRMKVLVDNARKGQIKRVEELCKMSKSEVLILVDADIVMNIDAIDFLAKVISRKTNIGLVGSCAFPLPPKTFIQKSVLASVRGYVDYAQQYKDGQNIYTCKGGALALSRKFASEVKIPEDVFAHDHFLYLFCLQQGHKYFYERRAKVWYTTPATLSDHIKQNTRFESTMSNLDKTFGDFVAREYRMDRALFYKSLAKQFIREPLYSTFIVLINLYCKLYGRLNYRRVNPLWSMVESTKIATGRKGSPNV